MTKTLTSDHLRCGTGLCPSVTQLDDGRLEITGDLAAPVQGFGDDVVEATIRISPDYFSNLPEMIALRDALKEVMTWISNWDPAFIHDEEWDDTYMKVMRALANERGSQEGNSGTDQEGGDRAGDES